MNEIGEDNSLYVATREEWRKWLELNFAQRLEIWLIFPKQSSGKQRLPYNDAVEEALCFGWIDSTMKSLDEHHSAQRFTPRRPGSPFSQPNKERLKWLAEQNMIHPDVLLSVGKVLKEDFYFPVDILRELKKDPQVWENFQRFSSSYQRIRIAYIEAARKRPGEYEKRLNNFISKTKAGKKIRGHGGVDKYY